MSDLTAQSGPIRTTSHPSGAHPTSTINVGHNERWVSTIAGGALLTYGLLQKSWSGVWMGVAGGMLLYRGVTGHCPIFEAMGKNTANVSGTHMMAVPHHQGVLVEKSITILKSPEELYRYWRNFENLPQVMRHLVSVTPAANGRSHWVAKAPAGRTVEWDAEIINEKENELIAWRSLEGTEINHAGSVRFHPATGGRGTEVKVTLNYTPPAGMVGVAIAKLFGEEPDLQISEDLKRFKSLMEAGEVPTIAGQPKG